MDDLTKAEWKQWRVICHRLALAGAITQEDLNSPVHADHTDGQKLLSDIRYWGDLRAKQGSQKK